MKKVSIFLAEGFEEVEALTPVDLLRRAGAEVTLVSIGDKKEVAGSHGIIITADRLFVDTDFADADLLILPGGMPGTLNLKACDPLLELLKEHNARGRKLAAICAAPTALAAFGVLQGKKATVYPGMDADLTAAGAAYTGLPLTIDGNIITGEALGAAIPFALAIARELAGADAAARVKKAIVYQ